MSVKLVSEIELCEHRRCAALVAGDYDALASYIADDLVHIHANGSCEGKADYLQSIQAKLDFLVVERPSMAVREYGDIAIVTGPLNQTVRVKGPGVVVEMQAMLTQVWRRDRDTWRLCSFQATKVE